MASIPLLCKICPKHPDFSDISHLLTHVSSKGHLSHYFKAQVRSRREPQVLQQLEAYDHWYDEYHIERLLSQRMILKESKSIANNTKNANSRSSTSAKPAKGTKKPVKAEAVVPHSGPHLKNEDVIDPQLSQVQPAPTMAFATRQSLSLDPMNDLPSRHRAYTPRMRAWPTASPHQHEPEVTEKREAQQNSRSAPDSYPESASENEQLFFRTPTKSIYPDPSTMSGIPQIGTFPSSSPILGNDHGKSHDKIDTEDAVPAVDEADTTQSPKLKGICWPGMDIFDSASPEAQRQRNQKKDDSILRQMELNSIVVEPLEQIFWPEGTLKKERLITGMVESSPMKEETPKPRRRRTTRGKGNSKNISTNNMPAATTYCQAPINSGCPELSYRNEDSHPADLGDLSKRALAMLPSPSAAYPKRANHYAEDANVEWDLTAGTSQGPRKRNFDVYDDDATEDEPEQSGGAMVSNSRAPEYPFLHRPFSQPASNQSPSTSYPSLGMPFPMPGNYLLSHGLGNGMVSSNERDLNHRLQGLPRNLSSNRALDKENIEPSLNSSGRIDDTVSQVGNGRSSQRYFSVTRGCPPRYFDTLPPHMVFGGWPGPRISGSSINPLNPSTQHQQVQQPHQHHSRVSTPALTHSISPLRMTATDLAAENHEYFFDNIGSRIENMRANYRRERL